MRILWYNWKDITNPAAGGAEVFTHEIAKRLVKNGHDITLFCSSYLNGKNEDVLDGVKIVRDGNKYSVYQKAKKYYKENKAEFDLVIDEINTRPFLTPDFVDKPIIALIHQLAREFWFYKTRFPINFIGYYWLENHWLKKYKKIPTVTVSNSTKNDLLQLGFEKVLIIPEGISNKPLEVIPAKEEVPTLIFVGRLEKTKLPDVAIKSFLEVKKKVRDAQLWIVGDGMMKKTLENATKNITSIKFWGRISNEKKLELMSRSHLLIIPAIREGWGLVVTEANSMGTPAIGYNVHGIRDSIKNNLTGILLGKNDVDTLTKEIEKIFSTTTVLTTLSANALIDSKQYSWDTSAAIFEQTAYSSLSND
jgi:glycosyltransferase involved in cell wall biosynthesis